MKRFLSILLFVAASVGFASCNDNDDNYYVSVSGDGNITVDYNVPLYLYRMVLFSDATEQQLYLFGGSGFVNGAGEFGGRGPAVKFVMPNPDGDKGLNAMSFEIGDDYMVSYAQYINYEDDVEDDDYTSLASGTVIIRRVGDLFDIKVLGIDAEGDNVIVAYRGYMYRSFYDAPTEPEPEDQE